MKNNITILVLTLIFVISCKSVDRNTHLNTKIPVEKLKKDIDYIEKRLFKMHPDVDWYVSKEQLVADFDSLRNLLKHPMKPNEFYFLVAPVVAKVRQGHMQMLPLHYTFPKEQKEKYKKSKHPLENIDFLYQHNKLYIQDHYRPNPNDSLLLSGAEVLAINNIEPQELYKKYEKTFTADGYITTMHPYYFSRKVADFYLFELGYQDSLRWTLKCQDSIYQYTTYRTYRKDRFENKNQKIIDSLYNNLSKADRRKIDLQQVEEDKINRLKGWDEKRKVYSKELIFPIANDSTIAILRVRDFVKGSEKVYEEMFATLKKANTKNLIIDIRDNSGGRLNDLHELTRYLNNEKFTLIDYPKVNSQLYFFNNFRQKSILHYIVLSPFLGTYGLFSTLSNFKDKNGNWRVDLSAASLSTPKKNAYKGKIYLIINGMTFSAGSILASHLEPKKEVTIVGEETGGTYNGTIAGNLPVLNLPNSKLIWRIGLMGIYPTNKIKEKGRGVKPDVEIKSTAQQIIDGVDPHLEWILKDIEKRKKSKR